MHVGIIDAPLDGLGVLSVSNGEIDDYLASVYGPERSEELLLLFRALRLLRFKAAFESQDFAGDRLPVGLEVIVCECGVSALAGCCMNTPGFSFRAAVGCGALFLANFALSQNPSAVPAGSSAVPAPAPPLKDAEGRTLRRAPTGHVTNYYEERVPPYTLPDPLVLADGSPVRDADIWFKRRRPEILKLYETEIFGRVPASAPKVRFEVLEKDISVLDGFALRKHIVGHFGEKPDGPTVNVMLYLPAKATGPVPVVLHITFGGDPQLAAVLPGDRSGQTPVSSRRERCLRQLRRPFRRV